MYKGSLYHVILTTKGLGVIPESSPPIGLVGRAGRAVTQAKNGNLVEICFSTNLVFVHIPNKGHATVLQVKSVFPRPHCRGLRQARGIGTGADGPSPACRL